MKDWRAATASAAYQRGWDDCMATIMGKATRDACAPPAKKVPREQITKSTTGMRT